MIAICTTRAMTERGMREVAALESDLKERQEAFIRRERVYRLRLDELRTELETLRSQGFDPVEKGFVIVVKKNGRVLRRLAGQPPWASLIGTMEVSDGAKFGMPGDDQRYAARAMKGDGML